MERHHLCGLVGGTQNHNPSYERMDLYIIKLLFSQGKTEVVRMLIAAGVDVNYASPVGNFKGKTSLMWASRFAMLILHLQHYN